MKKLLFTLSTAFMINLSFGQITTTIAPHTAGDTVSASTISFVAYFTNTGSTSIPAGDSLFFGIILDGATLISYGGTAGSVNFTVLDYDLLPGQRLERAASLNFVGVSATTYTQICAIGYIGSNNFATASGSCYVVNRSWTSTEEISLKEKTKVFVGNGMLNMTSTTNENLTYTVISINGQVVSQGNFTSNKQVDLNGVAKGIYAVVLSNGTEKVTKKVAVQ